MAAAALASVSGVLPALVGAGEDSSAVPAAEEQAAAELATAGGDVDGAVMAHVRDVSTGEISVFNGTREVVIKAPAIAARILRAVR